MSSENGNGYVELYRKHRPRKLSDIIGQEECIATLEDMIQTEKIPHAMLLTGASGVGKTTIARILRKVLKCGKMDFEEVNCASVEGSIETVRSIQSRMGLAPMSGKCRIWFLEEIQSWSRAGFAQQALLKMLEDTPPHVYFILATTDPSKLIPAIKTRCTTLTLKPLTNKQLRSLVESILEKEEKQIPIAVLDKLVEASSGSAREVLVRLGQVLALKEEEQQLEVLMASLEDPQVIGLCRSLLSSRSTWQEVSEILKNIEEEPESIRHAVLGYMGGVLLGGGVMSKRAYLVISRFQYPFYESKKPGLIATCWEIVNEGK